MGGREPARPAKARPVGRRTRPPLVRIDDCSRTGLAIRPERVAFRIRANPATEPTPVCRRAACQSRAARTNLAPLSSMALGDSMVAAAACREDPELMGERARQRDHFRRGPKMDVALLWALLNIAQAGR